MRFARHARIYRGPLDAAPLAGVAFLLVLFLLLTSLVYTPGALIRVAGAAETSAGAAEPLELTKSGSLVFRGKTYTNLDDAHAALRQEPVGRVNFNADPGANAALARAVGGWFDVNLPSAKQLTGANNPALIVAVNFRGQTFFDNRLMNEAELKTALGTRLQEARRRNSELTLTFAMDKDASIQVFLRLSDLARGIGFHEVVLGARQ